MHERVWDCEVVLAIREHVKQDVPFTPTAAEASHLPHSLEGVGGS